MHSQTTQQITGAIKLVPPAGGDSWVGRIVGGRYRVLEPIGEGGMGRVYRVVHETLGKHAAMKVLHPSHAMDRREARRFRKEAQTIARLEHEHIIKVFDFGEASGSWYLVTEFLPGTNLGAILRREEHLPPVRAAELLIKICHGMEHAHELGVVHRDLKPENVLVGRTARGLDIVKVVDFGIAEMLDAASLHGSSPEEEPSENQREIAGTPAYMAPEQILGQMPDPRTDVYALGVMLFALVCGDPPFSDENVRAILAMHLERAPELPTKHRPDLALDPRLDGIVLRAMAKAPGERYATVAKLRADLEGFVAQPPAPPVVAVAAQPSGRTERRRASDQGATLPLLEQKDVDAFDRRLRRAGTIRIACAVLLGLGLCGAALQLARRAAESADRPLAVEHEPNDDFDTANPIGRGMPVQGTLGRRRDLERSDRDCFRFAVAEALPQLARIACTGVPGIDLKVEVFDQAGKKLLGQDANPTGQGEIIPNLRIERGTYFVLVRQVWVPGRMPIENVSDAYRLEASWRPIAPHEEAEPDNVPEMALSFHAGEAVQGTLENRSDVDWWRLDAPPGCYAGRLVPPPPLDIRAASPRGGIFFDRYGRGLGEPVALEVLANEPALIAVRGSPRDPTQPEARYGLVLRPVPCDALVK